MDKLFLDTNVVVDFLCGREGFYLPAAKLVTKGYNKEVELWCSTLTLSTASYILEKNHVKYSQIINMLTELSKFASFPPLTRKWSNRLCHLILRTLKMLCSIFPPRSVESR